MAQRAVLRMQLRRIGDLLSQVRRGVDQKPVAVICTDGNAGLSALQFGPLTPGRPAHLATAIPLRNTTTCCSSENDDTQHEIAPSVS